MLMHLGQDRCLRPASPSSSFAGATLGDERALAGSEGAPAGAGRGAAAAAGHPQLGHRRRPTAIALSAIRDALETAAPRNLAGKRDNPLPQLLSNADIGWTVDRGPLR